MHTMVGQICLRWGMVEQILRELEKEGFSYVKDLLSSDDLKRIKAFFDLHKSEFRPAKVGDRNNRQRVESVRGDYTYWLDPINPPKDFKELFDFLNKLRERINARFYLGLQEYECHLAFYPPGTFYNKHLDRFEKNSSRRLSFIFYLNTEWNEEDGGELILYDQQGKELQKFFPMPGSFITFLSDEFPHEVKSGNKERRSFTGWMHTKIIY